ncbi:MAG: NAD-binding protein [Sphingopyxis sp.]|nr:NAD-binding protein [Sphingopyxis sp.]
MAKSVRDVELSMTATGALMGTPYYMSPEQAELTSLDIDTRTDIYALGASFYFLLAGHPAFPSGTVSQKLLWHRTKEPTPIRQIRPEVPDALVSILAKMMAKDFDLLLATAKETSVPLPLSALIRQLYAASIAQGRGEDDFFALTAVIEAWRA